MLSFTDWSLLLAPAPAAAPHAMPDLPNPLILSLNLSKYSLPFSLALSLNLPDLPFSPCWLSKLPARS